MTAMNDEFNILFLGGVITAKQFWNKKFTEEDIRETMSVESNEELERHLRNAEDSMELAENSAPTDAQRREAEDIKEDIKDFADIVEDHRRSSE